METLLCRYKFIRIWYIEATQNLHRLCEICILGSNISHFRFQLKILIFYNFYTNFIGINVWNANFVYLYHRRFAKLSPKIRIISEWFEFKQCYQIVLYFIKMRLFHLFGSKLQYCHGILNNVRYLSTYKNFQGLLDFDKKTRLT